MSELTFAKMRTHAGSFVSAHAEATEHNEPVALRLTPFVDDRGYSLMNLFVGVLGVGRGGGGQSNVSIQHPGVIKAWHRHKKQTDFWVCLHGHLKVGVHRDDGTAWQAVIGERSPVCVIIPPTLWHGAATVGASPATLLYYVTHEFDAANPDEERRAFDEPAGFPWGVENK
ncbi:MAG: dTDP-4-dehydrorhamnose 3,5-epimerase [Phycisphaerales bacterium]|jgi:dTDP-4-dehydrorhamnose 3,5-epimerase